MATNSEDAKPGGKAGSGGATEALKGMGETAKEMGDRTLEVNREFSVRMIEYAEKNTTEALAAARAAAQAKNMTELFEIQNNFFRDQLTRSANQVRELGELMMKANRETWQPIRDKLSGGDKRSGS